jgi:hypothetical protein
MRFLFYVKEAGAPGEWEVRSSLTGTQTFPSKEAALAAARQLCRKHWEERSWPCGVRLRGPDGVWSSVERIGDGARDVGTGRKLGKYPRKP